MIKVTETISINENEIHLSFTRSSGPGGQNVNKVATAVLLRFDIKNSSSLPDDVRKRLIKLAGRRVSADGILIIDARRFRTQEKNRRDAQLRLLNLIREASRRPKARHKTKPTLASKKRRLDRKNRRSRTKKLRRPVSKSEE